MSKRGTSDGKLVTRTKPRPAPKPEFSVDERDLPAIKDWSVGKKYTITLDVEMVSQSKDSDWDSYPGEVEKDKKIVRGRFKILSASPSEESDESKEK